MAAIDTVSDTDAEAPARCAAKMRVLAWPIDPFNPYTVLLYSGLEGKARVEAYSGRNFLHRQDIWHIHWPESLLNIRNPALAAFKLAGFLAMIDLVRLRGGKIVWTVHNLKAHDQLHEKLEAMFYRRFIPRVDGVISLSRTGLEMAREKFRRLRHLPSAVIPHGHYRDQYPPCTVDARAALSIPSDARVVLFFGAVRAYKNVEALVRAFREVADSNALLYIVGWSGESVLSESIRNAAAGDGRVRLKIEFIPREKVAAFFEAADLVVLPYRQILNSGSALLSLSLNRPVLVPDLGSMGDLKDDFGSDWVRTFPGEIDAATLQAALDWAARRRPSHLEMPKEYRWENIRAQTLRFYMQVMNQP